MLKKLLTLVTVGLLTVWVVGCSSDVTDSEIAQTEQNLTDDFGGYTASSEQIAFGDEELLASATEEVEYDDPILASAATDSIISDPAVGLYHFRAVWGSLRFDSTMTSPTEWNGSLTVTRGAEVIRRVIRFEVGQDYVVPRVDRKLVEWVSTTTVHNDGLAIDIFVPPLMPIFDTSYVVNTDSLGVEDTVTVVDTIIPEPEEVTVAFETGPYSRTFSTDDLIALDTVVELEDGNAVSFQAFRLDRVVCPRGFLAGKWGFNDEGDGVFQGRWMSRNGRISGYVEGHFGQNDEGGKVFFGKWISTSGEFEGYLKGRYGSFPNSHANIQAKRHAGGWINGYIYNADKVEIGQLKGRFASCENPERGHFFQARWKLNCAQGTNDEADGMEISDVDYDNEAGN